MQKIILLALLVLIIIPFVTDFAYATHFRSGHINWVPGSTPGQVEFNVINSFRRDGYSGTGPGGFPAVGNVITENIGGTSLNFGDGSFTGTLQYRVDQINVAENWIFAHAIDPLQPDGKIRHTYSSLGTFTAEIFSGDRTSTEINNPDGLYRVSTIVNLSLANSSPVSQADPIIDCPIGLCTFNLPAVDSETDTLEFRLSTSTEAGGGGDPCVTFFAFEQPGQCTTQPLSVSTIGVVTWNAAGFTPGLYSTSVTIDEFRGGVMIGKVMIDFLIDIHATIGNPPVFDVPPTPVSGTTFNINTGETLTFPVRCSDPDSSDTVSISHLGLPAGATLTPTSPTGNPASGTFSWTPATVGSTAITFTCTDNNNNQASSHNVVINRASPVAGPSITSFTVSDPDGGTDTGFSNGDQFTLRFSEATNKPGGNGIQNKAAVNNIFTFLPILGNDYTGQWIDSTTFRIVMLDITLNGNPQIGAAIAQVTGTNLKNAAGTSNPSTSTSPTLGGSFGIPEAPFITALVANDPNGGTDTGFSNGDQITARFSEATNQPGGTGVLSKTTVDQILTFSQILGTAPTAYTAIWDNPATLIITLSDVTGNGNPQIGVTTAQVNAGANLKNAAETSAVSTSVSPALSGSFSEFSVNLRVGAGGTASTVLPSGVTSEVTLQPGVSGTIRIDTDTASNAVSGGTAEFVGDVVDIIPSLGACTTQCDFSFTFLEDDVPSGIDPEDVEVLHDRNDLNDFADAGERLATTVTPSTPPGSFTATASDSDTSKFAVGGVRALFLAGGLSGEFAPPTFSSKAFAENEYPLTINGAGYKLDQYSNTIPTISLETGKPIQIKTLLYDPGGVTSIQHLAMYMNLRGLERDIQYSDTYIIYDKSAPTVVSDPNGFFDKITVTPTQVGNKLELTFDITFAKPMDTSDIMFRMWDDRRNNVDTKVFDAIVVTGAEVESAESESAEPVPTQENIQTTESISIPSWIKSNAGWWSDGQIGDSDFVSGIQYLINEGIMTIPETEAGQPTTQNIPAWIKSNAKWWSDGLISDSDFVSGIQWLVSNGIMRIG